MNPKYPVYVISKGRARRCMTNVRLHHMGVPHYVVIEPQEYDEYAQYVDAKRLLVTPFSNVGRGSIPVRNYVWNHSRDVLGTFRHWVMDDNLYGFYRLNRNKKIRVASGDILRCVEDFTDRYANVPMSGLNYQDLCIATDQLPPFYLNTRVYSCILLQNDCPHRWRGVCNEDTDLSLRILKGGYCTILFNAFLVGKTTTMQMKGGNTKEIYAQMDKRKEFAESLRRQHPDVVSVTWKFNRWHHHVDYSPFKRNKLIKRNDIQIPSGIDEYGMELKHVEDIQKGENR